MDSRLEAAFLHEIARAWHQTNLVYLGDALKPPQFAWTDSKNLLGSWNKGTRTISMSRPLAFDHRWGATIEVLKHEMAHQYADEVLGGHTTPHGDPFRHACKRLGISPEASGMPSVGVRDDRTKLVEKVQKLLALAKSANQHEAEAATQAAQRLMLEHNLSIGEPTSYNFVQVGPLMVRIPVFHKLLAALLAEHFFVEAIWVSSFDPKEGKAGSILELVGTPENLELASYIHQFLLQTAERLWREAQRKQGYPDGERRRFFAGVMQGVHEQLVAQRRVVAETGLVWVGDPALDLHFRKRHPYTRTRKTSVAASSGYAAGKAAGREIELHKGVGATREATRQIAEKKR